MTATEEAIDADRRLTRFEAGEDLMKVYGQHSYACAEAFKRADLVLLSGIARANLAKLLANQPSSSSLAEAVEPSTPEQIAELKRATAGMTPGPWYVQLPEDLFPAIVIGGSNPDSRHAVAINDCRDQNGGDMDELRANAAGIVALVNAHDSLLAAAERAVKLEQIASDLSRLVRVLHTDCQSPKYEFCEDYEAMKKFDALAKG